MTLEKGCLDPAAIRDENSPRERMDPQLLAFDRSNLLAKTVAAMHGRWIRWFALALALAVDGPRDTHPEDPMSIEQYVDTVVGGLGTVEEVRIR